MKVEIELELNVTLNISFDIKNMWVILVCLLIMCNSLLQNSTIKTTQIVSYP